MEIKWNDASKSTWRRVGSPWELACCYHEIPQDFTVLPRQKLISSSLRLLQPSSYPGHEAAIYCFSACFLLSFPPFSFSLLPFICSSSSLYYLSCFLLPPSTYPQRLKKYIQHKKSKFIVEEKNRCRENEDREVIMLELKRNA